MRSFEQECPGVLRVEGFWAETLAGAEKHARRESGEPGHANRERTVLNRRRFGKGDRARIASNEIVEIRLGNVVKELESLKKRRRKKDIERRLPEGPRAPWPATMHAPSRELILGVTAAWFEREVSEVWDDLRAFPDEVFERVAKQWLTDTFGAGYMQDARMSTKRLATSTA